MKVELIKFGLWWYPLASADSCRLHLPVLVLPAGAVFLSKTGQNGLSMSARLLYERGTKLLKACEKTSRKFISSSVQKWLACLLTDAPASYLCNQSKGWKLVYNCFIYSLRANRTFILHNLRFIQLNFVRGYNCVISTLYISDRINFLL